MFTLDAVLVLPLAGADMSTMVAPGEDMSIEVAPATPRLAAARAVYEPTSGLFSMYRNKSAQGVSYVNPKAEARANECPCAYLN